MRRIAGRRQYNLIQLQLMARLHCQHQMPNMYRIEGAAENADALATAFVF
jgi:hypothetical protein